MDHLIGELLYYKYKYSSAMAERPRELGDFTELGDFMRVGQFEAIFYVEVLRFAPIYGPFDWGIVILQL